MKIDHLALWVTDLEKMKVFYQKYFQATSGEKYFNPKKNFESYFLSFENGCRLEIMKMPGIPVSENDIYRQFTGLIHFAISTGSKQTVDHLTEQLRADGYEIVGEPRTTGDGYYESVVLDPEGNRIEITE
ncbi:MAG TPA: VOC family protein [Ohtaekwangia sp.]|uniref:VOC family protein n=1 Tax=Ohtaekwangia sp. TaxID=2066019 RepID=UPI002F93CE27